MSRKLLDSNFCALPWSGFIMQADGRVKNCVLAKDVLGNAHESNIEDILKSPKNIEIKQQMLQGLYPTSCDGCYYQEQGRQKSFDNILQL